ncbi:J domain-containing protein [bacterium]|nr:J domain-containing protein [bacterium]
MSKDPRGYYQTLGVSYSATYEEIKISYRNLAKRCHPDLNKGHDTTALFQSINEAYSVLSDPIQRRNYDQSGSPIQSVSRSQSARQNVYESKPQIDPYHCVDCGCVSPQLRHILYTQVVSFLFGSHKTNIWGIFCEQCGSKRLTKASIITGAFGWMSAPGLLYSAHALGRNLTGGKKENLINLEISLRQAVYYHLNGDKKNARIAATDARQFANGVQDGWWNDNEKRRAKELKPIIDEILD